MTAIEGQQFGSWTLMKLDPTRKRALVICQCGATGQVSTEALLSRETVGCGCRMTKRPVAPSKPVALREGERADGLKMTSAERGGGDDPSGRAPYTNSFASQVADILRRVGA